MSNIEDDVKVVKRYLENSSYKESNSDFFKNGGWEIVDLEIPQAMSNIMKEREQDKARIKELEEERQLVGMPVRNKRSGKIGIVLHQWESRSIAVLENISPRVINTHDSWDTLEIITDEIKQTKTESDSIPKQKIKDKIEELNRKEQELQNSITEEEREEYSDANISFQLCDIEIRREVLQELLQESEDK